MNGPAGRPVLKGKMRRALAACTAVVTLLALAPGAAWAWHRPVRSRVFVSVGPHWWGPPAYWWYGPPAYYVYTPPAVIVREPPVYIQQAPAPPPPPPPPPPPAPPAAQAYWYYCPSARAYYPSVQTCPEEWVKVPPR